MKKILLTAIAFPVLVLSVTGCHTQKLAAANDIPACIREKIKAAEADPQHARIREVYRYTYNGATIYYTVTDHCNDCFNQVYTTNCTPLCSPDGGFSGRGDGQCKDFFTASTGKALIWSKKP